MLLIIKYKYAALFPLAAIEGPVISLIIGFSIKLGYLSFLPSYIILIFGDLIPDLTYYYIGRFGNEKNLVEKYAKKSKFIKNNFEVINKLWHYHGVKTMFFSKLAYGLSTPFLISAGLVKMPVKRFIKYALPVTLLQYAVIMSIGYMLGSSYQAAEKYIKYTGLTIAGIIIVLIVGYVFLTRYIGKKVLHLDK